MSPPGSRKSDYVPLATLDTSDSDDVTSYPTSTSSSRTAAQPGWKVVGGPAVGSHFEPVRRLVRRSVELFNDNTGLLLIALSQGFASLMGVCVKLLKGLSDPPVHPFELIWVRMVMTWLVCVSYMSLTKVPDPVLGPKGVRHLLAARGLAGFTGLFGTYYALQYLSLSDATVLSFLTPMTTAVTGALFLKETLTLKQVSASVFSFAGVVLIARPEFLFGTHAEVEDAAGHVVTSSQRVGAVGVALLGVVGITGAYTTVRAIGKRAHTMHNIGAFSFFCVLTAPIAMLVTRTPVVIPDNLACLGMILAVSLCGFGAQMTLTMGLRRETAGRGSMAMYIQIIFALVFERVIFHTTPPPLSIVGTVIILASAIYIALSKQSSSKSTNKVGTLPDEASLEEGLLAAENRDDVPERRETAKVAVGDVPAAPPGEKFALASSTESLNDSSEHGHDEPQPSSSAGSSKSVSVDRI